LIFVTVKSVQDNHDGKTGQTRHGSDRHGRTPSKTWCRLQHAVYRQKLSGAISFGKAQNGNKAHYVNLWFNYEERRIDLEVINEQTHVKIQFSFHPNWGPKAEFADYWGDNERFED